MENFKLKRLNLDELAKVMPIVDESEQRAHVGSAYFYGTDGHFIGNSYDSNRFIYMIRPTAYYQYDGITHYYYNSEPFSFVDATLQEKKNVVYTMAASLGIYSLGFPTDLDPKYDGAYRNGMIEINLWANNFNLAYAEWAIMMVTLDHEKFHKNDPTIGQNQREYNAHINTLICPYFGLTPSSYQQGIWNRIAELKILLNIP